MNNREDTEFNSSLKSMRVIIAVKIKSMAEAGAVDEEEIELFRKAIGNEVFRVKRNVALTRQRAASTSDFKAYIHPELSELVDIINMLGAYALPENICAPASATDVLCHIAYRALRGLEDWMLDFYAAYLREPVYVPHGYCALAAYEIRKDLMPVVKELHDQRADAALIAVILRPFNLFLDDASFQDVSHHTLRNLRRLNSGLLAFCQELRTVPIDDALLGLLCQFNVNTRQAAVYIRQVIKTQLGDIDKVADKRALLAYHKKSLLQITPEPDIKFICRDPLVQQLLNFIEAEDTYLTSGAENERASGASPHQVMINVANEHYAVLMRVLQETAFFKGTQMDIVRATGNLFRSKDNHRLGAAAHLSNFKKPKQAAVLAVWQMLLRCLLWMTQNWGEEYGLPNLPDKNPEELKKIFSDAKRPFPPKK